jgi:peroxiredoxin Q/BCP
MARRPQVGDTAPDFELEGTDGTFRLAEHRGQRVVLLFYPGDNTPVCTRQFCSYAREPEQVDGLDAVLVGISSQDLESHELFVAEHGLNVPLLADTDCAVAKAYGAYARVVGTRRAMVIVNEAGVIADRHDHTLGLDFQSLDDIRAALARLDELRAAA